MANGNFGGGYGTVNNPYLVEDVADLIAINNRLDRHYKQVSDIDLKGIDRWTPIGFDHIDENKTYFNPFSGSYDGNGYVISNLRVVDDRTNNNPLPLVEPSVVGLFAGVRYGTLRNITIESAYFDVRVSTVGILAFQADSGSLIENCKTKNCEVITYGSGVGGLVYVTYRGATIIDCEVDNLKVRHNTAYYMGGDITVAGQILGGLIGYVYFGGPSYLATTISRCAVKNLTLVRDDIYASWATRGGFVGKVLCDSAIINDCYVTGYMYDYLRSEVNELGGLIGTFEGNSRVINCYAAIKSEIDWERTDDGELKYGGLIGDVGDAVDVEEQIINCYYDSQLFDGGNNGYGNPRRTPQMKRRSNYLDWDFETVWVIRNGLDYPFLRNRMIEYGECKSIPFPLDFRKMTVN